MIRVNRTILFVAAMFILNSAVAQRVVPLGMGPTVPLEGVFCVLEHQGQLVIGGSFARFLGHERFNLQAWDGVAHYDLPGAFETPANRVRAMIAFEGDLVVAGYESNFGNIARWNGSGWSSIGGGLSTPIFALAVHEGALHAAGSAGQVWRWSGNAWSPVGSALGAPVHSLCVHDGRLYAGGAFSATSSGVPGLDHIARWSGSSWVPEGSGLSGSVFTMQSDPLGLLVGGEFTSTADLTLSLPYWTIINSEGFVEPPAGLASSSVVGFHRLPDGRLLVGGELGVLVTDGSSTLSEFAFMEMRGGSAYGGSTILFGSGSMVLGHELTVAIGRMEEGPIETALDLNSIRAGIAPFPDAFTQGLGNPSFEVPKGSGSHSVQVAAPWLVGTVQGLEHGFAMLYRRALETWPRHPWAGPVADEMDLAFYVRYHRVWKLDRSTIQYHIAMWDQPGYTIPEAILSWPGNGDVANGEPARLAPFMDVDGDGLYEPFAGDHPIIRGDQAVYTITHAAEDVTWGMTPMSVDLHSMYYVFDGTTAPELDGAVFVNHRYVNRGSLTYGNVRFGQFFEPAIGCGNDDVMGCDTLRHMVFGYNGLDVDVGCVGALGYGIDPPAVGFKFLNEAMRTHKVLTRVDDGVEPIADIMNGLWNGQPLNYNGVPSNFQFPGGPNVDAFLPAAAVGRRSVATTGPFIFAPGDTLCFDLAFLHARAASGGALASLDVLLQRADQVQAFYDNGGLDCTVDPVMVAVQEQVRATPVVKLYPNPAGTRVSCTAETGLREIVVRDTQGRVRLAERPSGTHYDMVTDQLAAGLYMVEVRTGSGVIMLRLVIE